MATVKKMKKAQEGAGVSKGKVQGEMTGKMYDKKTFMARKDSASADLQKAIGPKKSAPKKKMKSGGAFGMLSVEAGIDDNPNPTQADRIAGAKKSAGKAKSGVSLKKQAAIAIAMKKAGKTPKKKMKYGGKAASMAPKKAMSGMKMMMSGGKYKYGCK